MQKDWIQDWRNRKTTNKKRNKQFVKKLKRVQAKKLDQLGDDIHEAVFQDIDCLDCANCCTTIPPMLNPADINRISKRLGMKTARFMETYVTIDEDGDTVMNTSPCPFLLEDHTCLIYEDRPKACRQYPHTDQHEFSQHLKLHAINANHCPAVFHILERMMEQIP
jgi:hypothetical protein